MAVSDRCVLNTGCVRYVVVRGTAIAGASSEPSYPTPKAWQTRASAATSVFSSPGGVDDVRGLAGDPGEHGVEEVAVHDLDATRPQ